MSAAKERRPTPSSAGVSSRMRAQRERDTAAELRMRKLLHAAGFRYRLHRRVPGTRREIDIALVKYKFAIFIDGCFWHGCAEHGTVPRANRDWWVTKLAVNRARDMDTNERLTAAGWRVVRVWEHEDPDQVANLLISSLRDADPATVRTHDPGGG